MISLMIFSLGLCKKFGWSKRILLGSIVPYILIFLFRPWLAITFLPLFLYILKSRFQIKFWYRILLSLFLCFLPYFVENLFIKFNNIDQAFPQQTFMIHDLSSLYCLSSDDSARQDAKNALLLLKNSGTSKEIEFLCLAFKPNSWGYSVSGNYPSNLGLEEPSVPVIEPIKPNDETKLTKFQTHWFNTIISNSTDYLQIKLFHFSQVLIGGESLVVDFNFTDLLSFGSELYNFPWKLMVFLHLFSPFFLIIFYLIFKNYIKRYVNHSINNILFLIFLFWIAITTIGFISDNGRYTYLPAILIYLYWLVQYTRFKQNLD
jgi:hypothetical protein